MKKVIQLILTQEETYLLNNKPIKPCMQCCVGEINCNVVCDKYNEYEKQMSKFDYELVDVASKVAEIKDIRDRMVQLSKQMTVLINAIPSEYYQHIQPLGVEFSPNEEEKEDDDNGPWEFKPGVPEV